MVYVLIWPVLLACFSIVIISYAKKYDRWIGGIYAAVMAVIVMFTAIESELFRGTEGLKDPFTMLQAFFMYMGFTGCTILLSLSTVAEKRPIKVKRWLRFSYLCLGVSLLFKSIMVYRANPSLAIWKWDGQANALLVLWLMLYMFLHGKQAYTKKTCILPMMLIIIWKDMSTRVSLLAVVIMGILALVVIVKMRLLSLPEIQYRDPNHLFQFATIVYGGSILLVSAYAGLFLKYPSSMIYNILTIAYILVIVLVLLLRQERLSYLSYAMILIWDIVLTLLLKVLYPQLNIAVVVLFGICLLPVLFFLLRIKRTWKSGFEVSHMALLVMIISGILCCGLRGVYNGSAHIFLYSFWIGAGTVLAYTLYCMTKRLV